MSLNTFSGFSCTIEPEPNSKNTAKTLLGSEEGPMWRLQMSWGTGSFKVNVNELHLTNLDARLARAAHLEKTFAAFLK